MSGNPIRRPNGLMRDCLAARVLDFMENNQLGLAALAAAAEVVAADCRFNVWVSEEVKNDTSLTIDWWEDFLRACAEIDEKCSAAMTALIAGGSEKAFCEEMLAVTTFYNGRRLVREVSATHSVD